ncbi:MAG: ATP-binding protein [Bacteroidales bacterium]|nr:ATP-binding protein [Deltaproteobacteria bacterium]MBL7138637.1 ATP-binding protein [Bacteroidales bacterium]
MITRIAELRIKDLLQGFPCVAIIGPRQVGKTTLAKQIQKSYVESIYIDLELQRDLIKLDDPETYLKQIEDQLIIIDEVQRKKELFPVLRALIDQNRRPGRFLLLGSVAPDLLRNSAESLAGRIAYYELTPFLIPEIYPKYHIMDLWVRGGFPDPFLHQKYWLDWMNNFVKTYFERDLPNLGFPADSLTGERLLAMLAHHHGNLINYAEIGKSLELSIHTIKKYIGFLENAFLVRLIQPFHSNVKKRLVKSPKVYISDSGILHYLSGIDTKEQLFGHPKMGASWEGFVIEQITSLIRPNRKLYFYRTHDGAELDLVITKAERPIAGIEIKFGSGVSVSRGNTEAVQFLNTKQNFLLIKEDEDYMLSNGFRVCGLNVFLGKYLNII